MDDGYGMKARIYKYNSTAGLTYSLETIVFIFDIFN